MTHLVLGESGKRTLKVLHAIARGAWLLQPEWLLRSAAEGAWLPEGPFADNAFPGAARARACAGDLAKRPLAGVRVAVAEPRRVAPPAAELRSLVAALGGAPPRAGKADVVIAAGASGPPPKGAAGAVVVTEQWLFDAVANYERPADASRYAVPRA